MHEKLKTTRRNKTCLHVYLRLPSTKSASTSNRPSFSFFLPVQVITHPLYSSSTINNDIALLKLASPVVFTPRISPVCLAPSTINILPGTRCFTTGWGRTATTCKLDKDLLDKDELQKLLLYTCFVFSTWLWTVCLMFSFFRESSNPAANRSAHHESCCVQTDLGSEPNHWCHDLCWSLWILILHGTWRQIRTNTLPFPCCCCFDLKCVFVSVWFPQGDSGGPLVCERSGVWTLVGSVSWGIRTCDTRFPVVYARISQLRSWIDKTIASN